MADARQPVARGRTFWGIAGDLFFFGVGATFAGQTTVIPSFLATLTQSAPLIGMASTIVTGGWLIPQLFAANRLAGLRRRKASVAIPATVGRTMQSEPRATAGESRHEARADSPERWRPLS